MPFIQENNIEINIGLKGKYKLIHISDVHAVTYRDCDSIEAKEEAEKAEELWFRQRTWFADKASEHYDDSHMIPSRECLRKLVEYINEEKPICAVLSGDIIDYYSDSNYDMLEEACGSLNYPYVFACGNHETPVERMEDITMNPDGFMVLELNEFKIISLDNSTKKVTRETLDSLKEELEEKKPVIIVMHIPVCTESNREDMKDQDPYFLIDEDDTDDITREFIDMLKEDDTIKAVLSGHVHRKLESSIVPGKMQYCASSGLIGFVNRIIVK